MNINEEKLVEKLTKKVLNESGLGSTADELMDEVYNELEIAHNALHRAMMKVLIGAKECPQFNNIRGLITDADNSVIAARKIFI